MRAMTVERGARALELPAIDELRKLEIPSRWLWIASLAALLMATTTLAMQWRDPDLSRLRIEGKFERVSPQVLREAALPSLGQGFFSVDVDAVREELTQLPWVAKARVERDWPTGLSIRVWEREPFARWNGESLLDTGGVAFTPAAQDMPESLLGKLPRLSGTAGNEALVASSYRRLSAALEDTVLAINGLALDARGEWTAQTRMGLTLRLGDGDVADKLPVLTGALLAAVGNRLDEVAYVDLRYTNGFAIGWIANQTGEGQAGAPAAAIQGVKNNG